MTESDVLALLGRTPWLVERGYLERMAARLRSVRDFPSEQQLANFRDQQQRPKQQQGSVAVIGIGGMIEQKASLWSWLMGGTSTEEVGAALEWAVKSPSVDAIVLDVDSPGGTSYGVEELADAIFAARKSKPIVAVANSLMASAAYWIASQASSVVAAPGSDVGSIGVYLMHADLSQALADEGVKVSIIKAGKYKAELSPYEPLSAEAKDYLQEMVDETYLKFLRAVGRGRGKLAGTVASDFGQGRVLPADKAKAVGMIDSVKTLKQVLSGLMGSSSSTGSSSGRRTSASTEAQKRRLQQARRKQQVRRIQQSLRLRQHEGSYR